MQIEDIRTIVWSNIAQTRLQVKADGKWRDVPFVDAATLECDEDGVAQEPKRSPTEPEVSIG